MTDLPSQPPPDPNLSRLDGAIEVSRLGLEYCRALIAAERLPTQDLRDVAALFETAEQRLRELREKLVKVLPL